MKPTYTLLSSSVFLTAGLLLLASAPAEAGSFFPIGNFTDGDETVIVVEGTGDLQLNPTAAGLSAAGTLGFKGGSVQLYGHGNTTPYGADGLLAGVRYGFHGYWGPVTWLLGFDFAGGKIGGSWGGGFVVPVGLGVVVQRVRAQLVMTVGGMAGKHAPGGVSRGYAQVRVRLTGRMHAVGEYLLTTIDSKKNNGSVAPMLSLGVGYTFR